jgi:hypothetical protein
MMIIHCLSRPHPQPLSKGEGGLEPVTGQGLKGIEKNYPGNNDLKQSNHHTMNRIQQKSFIAITALLICTLLCSATVSAQVVPAGTEIRELIRISDRYKFSERLKFDVQYEFADSASPNQILEQLNGTYTIHNGKFHGMIDSTEYVQGAKYSMVIFHEDRIIAVNNRQEYPDIMKAPLMDTLFRSAQIDFSEVTAVNDTTRKIFFRFKSNSFYSSFSIEYDKRNYITRKAQYYVKTPASDDPGASGISLITARFTNYRQETIQESEFDEFKFIQLSNGQLVPKAPYTSYQVMSGAQQ